MDDDQQAEIRNKMLGFIFQQYNLIPKLTVLENVELPPAVRRCRAEERKERAGALGRVGLASKTCPVSSRRYSSGCPSRSAGGESLCYSGR